MSLLLAWTGGALFLASLGWCVYFVAVGLATPAPPSTPLLPALLVDAGLFTAFALHHSLFARTAVKQAVARLVPRGTERSLYVWIASLLLLVVCTAWWPLPGVAYTVPGAWRWPLYAVQTLGAALVWRGAAVIDVLDLAGVRQARGQRAAPALRIVGPFRVVRHPIYLGWLLLVFAAPTMTVNRLAFACLSSAYLIAAIPLEERSLARTFGDAYERYQVLVPWRLVPRIW